VIRVLLVEDDLDIAEPLARALTLEAARPEG
jgi:DNA-binding response OmpR family regulator